MTTAKRIRNQVKTTENKEGKMNARKAFCVVCVLVVGLALAVEITPLAAPPSVEYRPGVNLIYRGTGYNVAPKVSVPLYRAEDSKLPALHRGSTSSHGAKPMPKQAHPGLMSEMYVVPAVRVPTY